MNEQLLAEIIELSKHPNPQEDIEKLLERQVKKSPQDTELLLRLAILQIDPPLANPDKAIYYLNQVIEYEQHNVEAILILGFAYSMYLDGINEDLFNRLSNVKVRSASDKSMIEYVKSWRYWNTEEPPYEELLLKSIEVCSCHVYNYVDLGRYYLKRGVVEKGKDLLNLALNNVQSIYFADIDVIDITSIKEFFNERIKGIHLPKFKVDFIRRDL